MTPSHQASMNLRGGANDQLRDGLNKSPMGSEELGLDEKVEVRFNLAIDKGRNVWNRQH